MDHEERVRRFSTPWEDLSPEQRERRIRTDEEIARLRAEGRVMPPSMQEKCNQFVPGLDENMQPLHPRRQDGVESEETNEQDREA